MQLSFNPKTPNFKAVLVAPSGQKGIENADSQRHRFGMGRYIEEQTEQRKDDKYVDAIITGFPDEYGYYWPVLNIHDKVTGENLRGDFKVETPHGEFGYYDCYSKDGRLLPDNVAMLTDVEGKTRYFTYNDDTGARRLKNSLKDHNWTITMGLVSEMEEYYKNSLDEGTIPKDKYATLVRNLKEKYDKPFDKVVPDIMNEDNLLGKGREKDVYKIPDMPDYVLCVVRDKYKAGDSITPFYQCFQSTDLTANDEPIMTNDNGMFVKKYTSGKAHSLPNWFDKFHGNKPLTYDDVTLFVSQLEELSSFPGKTYVNFAKKLQKFNEEDLKIDTVNPNNLLIDSEFKTIDVIDISTKDRQSIYGVRRPINNLSDMESLLLDSMMFTKYYDMANDGDKIKMDTYSKKIIDKCVAAEKVANLGNCTENTGWYLKSIDDKMPMEDGSTRKGRFEEFLHHFDGIIPQEFKDPEKVFNRKMFGTE